MLDNVGRQMHHPMQAANILGRAAAHQPRFQIYEFRIRKPAHSLNIDPTPQLLLA